MLCTGEKSTRDLGWFWQLVRVYENQDEADREVTILGTGKDGFANAVVVVREYIAKRAKLGIK